jgi:hypothetical protein
MEKLENLYRQVDGAITVNKGAPLADDAAILTAYDRPEAEGRFLYLQSKIMLQ